MTRDEIGRCRFGKVLPFDRNSARFGLIYKSPGPAGLCFTCLPTLVFLSRMEGAHHSSSSLPTAGSVNIERAETSFHELSRQLTQGTVVDDEEQAAGYSRANESRKTRDVEKGALDAERPFDLREYLTSSNDANERAGIKHKHVGVLWDDFHVDVLGGSDFKVGGKPLQGVTIADSSDRGNSSLFARSEVSR